MIHFDSVIIVVLFLPGILLLSVLSKKRGIVLNFLEKVLYGSILWNYLLVAPSIILGLFMQWITVYFITFTIISIITMIICVAYLINDLKMPSITTFRIKSEHIPYIICFQLFLMLSLTAICFHTFYVEWDAIAYYIPNAKSILTTGGITYNPYRSLNFIEHPPAISIIYAWLLNYLSLEHLCSLTITYFLLTIIAIILIAKKLLPQENALIPALFFMSLPTVIIVISSRSLYLDLFFLQYLLSTLYCMIKIMGARETPYNQLWLECVMFSMGFTLMILTRTEVGILLAPPIFATFIFLFSPLNKVKNWGLIVASSLGLSYYIREIRNIVLDSLSWVYYIQRLTPAFIISGLTLLIIRGIGNIPSIQNLDIGGRVLSKRFMLTFLVLMIPFLIYILWNVTVLGFIIPIIPISNSEILKSAAFFRKVNPIKSITLAEMLRWDYFVSVWWLIPPYLPPILVFLASSLLIIIKKVNTQNTALPLLLSFAGIFILWSNLACDSQPRRLYYFAPFIALAIAHGLHKIKKFFNNFNFALRIFTYITAITTYIIAKMNAKTINDIALFYVKTYQPDIDIELTITSVLVFLIIFTPYEHIIKRLRKSSRFSFKKPAIIILVFYLNAILIMNSISPMLIDAITNDQQSKYKYYGGWYHYPDVVNYYNENITDNFVTLCFYCHELITFANRSIIDLSSHIYGLPIYSVIATANETEMLNKMKELNVKYFLKPKRNNSFFSAYEKLINGTVLGKILVKDPQCRYLADFKYVTLYTLYENYTLIQLTPTTITPWNYNRGANYTLVVKENMTNFTATTNDDGVISTMYVFVPPLSMGEALWLTVKSYNQSQFVIIMFTNLQNRTTDYFIYRYELTNRTESLVINLKQGMVRGNFNPDHVEGILIGIKNQPNVVQTLEIHNFHMVIYND